jgi:hypothetical protein
MKYIITIIITLIAVLAFGQRPNNYGLSSDNDTTFLLITQSELGNGKNALTYEPSGTALDTAGIIRYIVDEIQAQSKYESRNTAKALRRKVQANRLKQLLVQEFGVNYYDRSWEDLGEQFTGEYILRLPGGEPIRVVGTINQIGRLIFGSPSDTSPVRIESSESFTIINLDDINEEITFYENFRENGQILYRGELSDGGYANMIKVK